MARLLAEIGDEPKCDLEWDAFDYHIIRLKDERAVPPWSEIATLSLPTGLFAFVYARGAGMQHGFWRIGEHRRHPIATLN